MNLDTPENLKATPERISSLAHELQTQIAESIKQIGEINLQSRVLSMNAQIEAARAGQAGKAFGILGQEMVTFSGSIQKAAFNLERRAEVLVNELAEISRALATNVRGTRLADLAHTNIDVIDRNLYERSCDCRWWATDAAMVSTLEEAHDPAAIAHGCQRLGVILKAYTVYFDIVIADLEGRIIANGRAQEYPSIGSLHPTAQWFESALNTSSGDEYGFESVHLSPLVRGNRALVYSCKICRGGDAAGEPIGVLGVVFNWDGLAQKIVHETPIEAEKKALTRVCIVDADGRVLADTRGRALTDQLEFAGREALFSSGKGSVVAEVSGKMHLIAHAVSPGFETYRTGWHSVILEQLEG